MPILVVTQPDRRRWDYDPHPPSYMIDGDYLAKQALGYAHVVLLPFLFGYEWTRRVGQSWTAYDGAIRLYMPGLNCSEDTPRQHPVAFKRQIHEYIYGEQKGGRAFAKFLADRLATYGAKRPIRWDGSVFVPEARVREADRRARNITELTDLSDIHARYEAQIEALRQRVVESEQDSEQWLNEADAAQRIVDQVNEDLKDLRRTNDSLRLQLAHKLEAPVDSTLAIPETYDGMDEWVREHLAGRLDLHPRAIRGVKDAVYKDPALVYRSLLLLANEYRDMHRGACSRANYDARREELGITDSGSITEEQAGRYGDTYSVLFPRGSRSRRFLDRHLKKGSGKDDHTCLRIYFFWHGESQQVVVGWLPSHLQNQHS